MENRYLYIDVGGSSIKYAVMDKELNFYEKGSEPTPYEGIERYLDVLEGIYRRLGGNVVGTAMLVPEMIDSERGICVTDESSTCVEQFPLAKRLEERCQVPATITSDAKCTALAEVSCGALKDRQDAVVLVFGTGIGGALIKDSKVHTGKHFAAGELGFIMMEQECDLESSIWAKRNGSERLITMVARTRGVSSEGVTGSGVLRWAEDGDELVRKVLDKFTRDIAFMIMNFQVIFDPKLFTIGDGISRQLLLLIYIRKNLEYCESMLPYRVSRAQVTTCQYFNDANLVGALQYYLERE